MNSSKNQTSEETNLLDRITAVLEQNIRGVHLGIYSVAICGLAVALRSVRPFAKFSKPSQIPKHFFETHTKLSGKVLGIETFENKSILLVDHTPILAAKLRRKETRLPVEVEGIDITGNGLCWLQTIVRGDDVDFILLRPYDESVGCLVFHRKRNIANHLISLGFASVAPYNMLLDNNKLFAKYYHSLLKEEAKAERKRVGMWWDYRRVNVFLNYLFMTTRKLKINIL